MNVDVKIFNFINFKNVDSLLDGFNQKTGLVTAIPALKGNVFPNRAEDGSVLTFNAPGILDQSFKAVTP